MKDNKKVVIAEFDIDQLLGIGFTFIVLTIGLAYGINVAGDVKDDMASCTSGYTYNKTDDLCWNSSDTTLGLTNPHRPTGAEFNASDQGIIALGKIPNKLGLIVTVVLASVIIGILVSYLWVKFK